MTPTITSDTPPTVTRHRWSLEDWDAMIRTGVLGEDDHVELLEGEIVEMSPIGRGHSGITTCLMIDFATLATARRAGITCQNPVRIPGSDTELHPDFMVMTWRDDKYAGRKVESSEALLVVEVADTSLRKDIEVKAPVYARAGIPECWIIDVNRRRVHVFRKPTERGYADCTVVSAGTVASASFPDVEVSLAELFLNL